MPRLALLDLLQQFGSRLTNLAPPPPPASGFTPQAFPGVDLLPALPMQDGGFTSLPATVLAPPMQNEGFMSLCAAAPPSAGFTPPASAGILPQASSCFMACLPAPPASNTPQFTMVSAPLSGPCPLLGAPPTVAMELDPNIMPIPLAGSQKMSQQRIAVK
ncbi:hypothetical protein C0993_000513 [Termitomyces sp. T159_Od127]|nr:hypothetical protein C0993_000513 [Termitomyces sp. T159_Od127]